MVFLIFAVVAGLGGLFAFTNFDMPALDALQDWPIATAVIGLLVALYLATLASHRGERRFALWPTLVACASGVVLAAGAFNKSESFALADLIPVATSSSEARRLPDNAQASVRLRRRDDGGFVANSEINGQSMPIRVDTGSTTVVLRQSDAEKAGIDVGRLAFDTPFKTANGTSYLAPVRLKSVRVGQIVVDDVEGLVARPGTLNDNLLGTSFLRRLASYRISSDFATLRQ